MAGHRIGSREEWLAARKALLEREKAWTRAGDELAAARRELPWVRVEKDYAFDTASGKRSLAELFDGRSQLLVYHFMFGPSYEAGCPTCSSMADTFDGAVVHLRARDATFVCISRAPLRKLLAYRARMGWRFDWASSFGTDFNFDFGTSFTPEGLRSGIEYNYVERKLGDLLENPPPTMIDIARGSGTDLAGYLTEGPAFSAFVREDGAVYHTYSSFARGVEFLMGYYPILDRAPKGRQEEGGDFWIRRKDEYDAG